MVPVRLISLGKQFTLKIDWEKIDWEDKDSINLPHVIGYYFGAKTDKMSIAKTYEDENTMIVTLQIPKSDYKNKSFQNLLKCPELPVQDEYYYRDWAVHMVMAGDNEKTVLFSHGRITLDIKDNVKADYVTVEVVVKQKEDMLRGVVFGLELGETYKEAREKIENPVGLNVVVPIVAASSGVVLTGIKNAKEITEDDIVDEDQDLENNDRDFANPPLSFYGLSLGNDLHNADFYSIQINGLSKNATYYAENHYNDYSLNKRKPLGLIEDLKVRYAAYLVNEKTQPTYNPAQFFAEKIGQAKSYYINGASSTDVSKIMLESALKNYSIVYLCTHGSSSGLYIQQLEYNNNGKIILNYVKDNSHDEYLFKVFNVNEYVKYDFFSKNLVNCKWLIIHGCAQLNKGLKYKDSNGNDVEEKIDGSKNAKAWADALLRNKNMHGILAYKGYAPSGVPQLDVIYDFITACKNNSIIKSWKIANVRDSSDKFLHSDKNWAMVYNSKNAEDTLTKLTPDDNTKGELRKINFEGYMYDGVQSI